MPSPLTVITCYRKVPKFSYVLLVTISVTVLVLGLANSNRILAPSSHEETIKHLFLNKVNNKSGHYYREIPNLHDNDGRGNYPPSIPSSSSSASSSVASRHQPHVVHHSPPSTAATEHFDDDGEDLLHHHHHHHHQQQQHHRPPRPPVPAGAEEEPPLPPVVADVPPPPDEDIKRRLLSLFSQRLQQQRIPLRPTIEPFFESSSPPPPSPPPPSPSSSSSKPASESPPYRPPISSSSDSDFDYFTVAKVSPSSVPVPVTVPVMSSTLPPPLPTALNLSTNSQKIAQLFRELIDSRSAAAAAAAATGTGAVSNAPYRATGAGTICGDHQITITISTNYEISSPNYPQPYPPNLHCVWHIQAQKDQLLKVQIFKLHLEHDDNCRFDRLDVKGVHQLDKKTGKTVIRTKRFCGTYSRGREFEIGANHTTIEFHSDSYNEYPGFHLRIIAQSQDCTYEMFVHNYSYITSPNYPEPYEDSKNCWTWIRTRDDHRLLVSFEDLHLESGIRCEFDYVEVFDAPRATPDRSLGRFCTFPAKSSLYIHSSGNSLLFHFESDNFLALRGYKAKIVTLRKDVNISRYMDCDWNADWHNMTIASPLYPEPYPAGSRCETSISAPSPNERIILLFDWIDLIDDDNDDVIYHLGDVSERPRSLTKPPADNYRMFNCSMDRLEIYERLNDTEPSNVFCGQHSQPFRYVSQSDSIRLVFRSVEVPPAINNQGRIRTGSAAAAVGFPQGFRAKFTFMTVTEKNGTKEELKTNKNHSKSKPGVNQMADANKWPVLIRRPENASVRLGSSHILYCEMGHNQDEDVPGSPIIWFKGDREIHDGVSDNGTSLLIRQFNPNSVGRYICVYGDNSSDAWLTLKPDTERCAASNVLFRERPRDQFTSEGEFVMLHCSATLAHNSNQDVEIQWERLPLIHPDDDEEERAAKSRSRPVVYNSRIKQLSRGDLLFDRVLVEDSCYYFCVVRLDQPWSSATAVATGSPYGNSSTPTNADATETEEDCVLKSVARVQINRRVDVRDFCGISTIGRHNEAGQDIADVGKIIGGTEAQPGEFPWMVMFWDEKRHVFCGGALLNERWVVTAAHCFTDILDEATVFVKLGKYDQTETEPTELVTKIQHTIKHPHFSNETFDNDIALVKLATHIQFTDHIRPICLATSSEEVRQMNSYFFSADYHRMNNRNQSPPVQRHNGDDDEEEPVVKFGYVTGWGRLKENGPLPRYLHKIRLPLVGRNKCRQSTTFKVTDNMFCAGYGKEIVGDACKGDSGGPFVVEWHSHWTLLGIVSWGEGCGRPGKYGYYTRVNNYDNWIRRLTAIN